MSPRTWSAAGVSIPIKKCFDACQKFAYADRITIAKQPFSNNDVRFCCSTRVGSAQVARKGAGGQRQLCRRRSVRTEYDGLHQLKRTRTRCVRPLNVVVRISAHTALGLGTGNGPGVKLSDSSFETGGQSKGFVVQLARKVRGEGGDGCGWVDRAVLGQLGACVELVMYLFTDLTDFDGGARSEVCSVDKARSSRARRSASRCCEG